MREKRYETVCIVNLDAGVDAVKDVVKKFSSAIEKEKGKDIQVSEWGRRKLAYPIKKKKEGNYVLFTYTAPSTSDKELDLALRYHETVLRYQTVVVEVKSIKAEGGAENA